ncbi:MAG: hypothetical protein AAGK37_21835 [Pseudomonadota bacterium]
MKKEEIELLSNSDIPDIVRQTIAEKILSRSDREAERALEAQRIASDNKKTAWNTPIVASLAALLTLAATFVFDTLTADQTTKNAITVQEVRQELELSEARLKQQLEADANENLARLEAEAREREFQYEIVRSELANAEKSNAERASVLLFLVRAGVLASLNERELSAMAQEQRENPDETIIPSLTVPFFVSDGSASERIQTATPLETFVTWDVLPPTASNSCIARTTPMWVLTSADGKLEQSGREAPFLVVEQTRSGIVQIAVAGGYTTGWSTTITVGDKSFELDGAGEFAYAKDYGENSELLLALRDHSETEVTAKSADGTEVTARFSAIGFEQALSAVRQMCSFTTSRP